MRPAILALWLLQVPALAQYDPEAPEPIARVRGEVVVYGAAFQGHREDFLGSLTEADIVVLVAAPGVDLDGEPGFVGSLRRVGARDVRWLHTKDRRAANGEVELLARLEDARGVWFGGGRQWNLVDSYQHTQVHRLVEAVLARGGVVGGSSAGASIQADYMARGNPLGNLDIMAEGYEEGLGLLTGVAVDQHFSQRRRLPDLESLVARHPQYLGIGIDEGAVLIVQGRVGEVLGSAVHFLQRSEGEQVHHRLTGGQRFDLVQRAPLGK
jgi:cyanophycinase